MTFFLTCIFIFMVMWRPQEWLVPWMFGWPILDLVVVGSLFSFVVEHDAGKITMPKRVPQLWLLGGLWFASAMSHVAHTYFGGMIETIPIVFKMVFFTALLICLLDSIERIRAVVIILVVMSGVMAIHALLQQSRGYGFAGHHPIFDRRLVSTGNPFRSLFFGIFGDPNDLAQMLITAIPLAFMIPKRMTFFSWLWCAGLSALLLFGALATQSRGGQVAMLAVAAVMTASILPPRLLPWCLGAVAIGGLAVCPFSGGLLDESAYDRVIFWGRANYAFKANPIFGIGYNMFWQVADNHAAHNAFVACYTELGFFGYVFWFGLLFLGILGTWQARKYLNKRGDSRERWLRRAAGMMIVAATGFAASSYFLSRTFQYPLFFLFALLAAIPIAAREFLSDRLRSRILPKYQVIYVMPLMALVSLVYIYYTIVLLNKAFHG